jgi:hypothetical protein
VSSDPFEDGPEPDDLDDALVEQLDALYDQPADPLAGEARPVNSCRRHRSRGRTVTDLPAL